LSADEEERPLFLPIDFDGGLAMALAAFVWACDDIIEENAAWVWLNREMTYSSASLLMYFIITTLLVVVLDLA